MPVASAIPLTKSTPFELDSGSPGTVRVTLAICRHQQALDTGAMECRDKPVWNRE